MNISKKQLCSICNLARVAAQEVSNEKIIEYFAPFPKGWCGCVSRVLGALLTYDFPNHKFYYVCGVRPSSHAWIEYEDYVLDVTADQFDDCNEAIIIKPYEDSLFHQSFHIETKRLCSIDDIQYPEENIIWQRMNRRMVAGILL